MYEVTDAGHVEGKAGVLKDTGVLGNILPCTFDLDVHAGI